MSVYDKTRINIKQYDAAKINVYVYGIYCNIETESNVMIRNKTEELFRS